MAKTYPYLNEEQAAQQVIQIASQLGIDPQEALSVWQQESNRSTDTSLPGVELSRGRGHAVGPMQVVPYYHPNFPVGGSFADQVKYALQYWKSGGDTVEERARNYYGTGTPPVGHPTPDQYAQQIASRIDTRMAGDPSNAGMPVPSAGPEDMGQQPLTNDVLSGLPADDNSSSLNGGPTSQQLLQQYLDSVTSQASPTEYKKPTLKDAMLEMGLGILANPAGAMASPLSGIARGIQEGIDRTNQQAQFDYEQQRAAATATQQQQHDMLYAAQIAAQQQKAMASGTGKTPAILQLAEQYRIARGHDSITEQDLNDANKIADPERVGQVAAAVSREKTQNKLAVEAVGNWNKTSQVYSKMIDGLARTQEVIDRMTNLIDTNPTVTGGLAGLFRIFPSDARAFADMAGMVKSNIALDLLKELKSLSPTGATGFGALSEGELKVIQSYLGTIDQLSDAADVRRVLADISRRLTEMRNDAQVGYYEDASYISNIQQVAPLLARPIQPLPQDATPGYQSPGQIFRQNMTGVVPTTQPAQPTQPADFNADQWELVQ